MVAERERKAALVVGGGTGIGYAAAVRLARRGYAVVLAGRRGDVLDEAAARFRSAVDGAFVETVAGDGGVEADAERMVRATVDAFGGLDVLVNCAGIYDPVHFLDLTEETWRRTMSATLDAQLYVSVAAARRMAEAGRGRIVLISSINSPLSEPESAHYSAAKAAVSSLVRSMAVDLSARGIQANAIAPGWVHTAMVDDFVREASAESLQRINILGRVGTPDEIANTIEYLAVDAPDYLTGATVFVDGGQTAMAPLP
jgi:NAD(P)-dependent dehydrogenase (short-subunit alcohol dehydrogenase family)